jgi:hypothetical protein
MAGSTASTASAVRSRLPFWAEVLLLAATAFAVLVVVGFTTSAALVTLWPRSFGFMGAGELVDPDLWWIVGIPFLVVGVVAFCGTLLAEALLDASRRSALEVVFRRAARVAFVSATAITAVIMVAVTVGGTALSD